jgi:hypothetical protein
MATTPRNRRSAARPAADEIMELNTGDVIPLFDDEVEILRDDELRPGPPVVMSPVEAPRPVRVAKKLPVAGPTPKPAPVAVRRPQKEAVPAVEAQETQITTALPGRTNHADVGYSEAFLYVEKGPGAGQLVPVLQGETVVGRSSESELQLNHPSVSRKHAVISRRAEQYFLVDAGSQNGTYVNWAKTRGEAEIFPGDQVSIGSAVLVLRGGLYTSAMRRGGTSAVETPSTRKVWVGVGLFGAAVGVGVAAVVLLASHKSAPVAPRPSLLVQAPAPVEAVPESKLVSRPVVADAKPVARTEVAEAQPVASKTAESRPAPIVIRDEEPVRHERAHKGHAARAEKVAAAESAPAEQAPQAVLKLYESGNLDAAIAAAEAANASKLAGKMKQFQSTFSAAKEALAAKDGAGAVAGFNKALKLDESIDSGWGKLNGEIRSQLAGLFVLAGNQAVSRGESATAIKAFKTAQSYQPANAEARTKLKELGGGAKEKPANAKAAADAAFDG